MNLGRSYCFGRTLCEIFRKTLKSHGLKRKIDQMAIGTFKSKWSTEITFLFDFSIGCSMY